MRISEHFEETIKQHEPELTKKAIRERALEVLRLMGIPPTRYKSYPHEFSGGMRQRLMIALALVLRPAFVVADEPTTALDVLVEAQIIQILNDLRRNFDTSLLLITHNLGIVAEACDRVAVMYAGRIVEQGDCARRVRQPAAPVHPRAAAVDDQPVKTTGLNFIPGAPPDLVDPPDGCRFHPRCPDAMEVCATQNPVDVERLGDGTGRVLAERARGADPAGRHRASRAGGAERCRRSLTPRAPTPWSTSRTCRCTSSCAAAAVARLFGRETGTVKAVDGRQPVAGTTARSSAWSARAAAVSRRSAGRSSDSCPPRPASIVFEGDDIA